MKRLAFVCTSAVTVILLLLGAAGAQPGDKGKQNKEDSKAEQKPGHSAHGEVFNEGPRQKAYLMGKTGKVHFAITTKSPLAQQFFDQGVGQLHGFWYFEAERSFRQVAALDPDCAMAYWGMAMANHENEKRARGFIEKAVALRKQASAREQRWIESYSAYLIAGPKERRNKQRRLLDELERIARDHDDIEAKAFLVCRTWQFRKSLAIPDYNAVDRILDEVFKVNPLHPAHHYRIHLWDERKPANALASAALGGPSGPAIAHMWHMPGHTYDKLKRYADAAWQQEASSRADHAHMMRDRVLPDQIHNYAHNQEWLVRSLSHIGRSRDAVELAKNLIELPRHPKYNTLSKSGRSAAHGRTRLLQVLERYELWEELIALCSSTYLEPTDLPAEQVKRLRALGLAHAGREDGARLSEVLTALQKSGKQKGSDALTELRGHEALLAGDTKKALDLFKKAKGTSKSVLARAYLEAGDAKKAEEVARQAADSAKNQVVPLADYIHVLYRCGKTKEAGAAFARLREISGHIDRLDTPVFARLAPVARALKLAADWRQPVKVAADVGARPSLDSIGPLRWQPPAAPEWARPDGSGKTVSLEDYRGRPVLVIFYLGHGCLHCVEQLNRFAPRTRDFAGAGIALVAVSTDSPEDLQKACEGYKEKGPFPFPLLSDARLEVFKRYRAHDDFENLPLHGTFLIDGNGRVRWQDISFEPFMDVDFVLRESRRLLALGVPGKQRTP